MIAENEVECVVRWYDELRTQQKKIRLEQIRQRLRNESAPPHRLFKEGLVLEA